MKTCDQCGERPARIRLKQIKDGQVIEQHLCDRCAEAHGVQTESKADQFPLAAFLSTLGGVTDALPSRPQEQGACVCGATLEDFRESGRLGCPTCYDTFEASLRTLLRRIHGASRHIGQPYAVPGATSAPPAARLLELRDELRRAIDAENFERAAQLRDHIRGIE